MALPRKLKLMNNFVDGVGYAGQINEMTLPKLAIKAEAYRAGGMIGEVDVDLGLEKLEVEIKAGGYMTELIKQFGGSINSVPFRFMGAYQKDDTDETDAIEVVMRGRFTEIDGGNSKVGDDTEHNFKASLTYYKLVMNGEEIVEVDMLNSIYRVAGQDRMAAARAAVGL